jgi:type 1 glutamine amidotransferase
MNRSVVVIVVAVLAWPVVVSRAQGPVPVMILDGESGGPYHDWQRITPALQKMLDETGLFATTVATAPPRDGDFSGFAPAFEQYRAVVLNYDAPDERWPDALKASFEQYVRGGGGVVSVHAADNAFPRWQAYNEMIGVGGWRGRTEQSGPYWFVRDGKLVSEAAPGPTGSHGRRVPFQVTTRDAAHPVMKGLPTVWMHQGDELYARLRGPGRNMTVLASAFSNSANAGTGRDEPILMALDFGKGRVFHTTLGHDLTAMSSVGFVVTLQRGTEWAATGRVTQTVPATFPTADTVSYRADIAAMDPDYSKGLDNLDLPRR